MYTLLGFVIQVEIAHIAVVILLALDQPYPRGWIDRVYFRFSDRFRVIWHENKGFYNGWIIQYFIMVSCVSYGNIYVPHD